MVTKLINAFKFYLSELPESRKLMAACPLNIMSSEETIRYILEKKCSIARFGDGEMDMIFSTVSEGYQKWDPCLRADLREVLERPNPDTLVCLPFCLTKKGIKHFCPVSARYWHRWVIRNLKQLHAAVSETAVSPRLFGDSHFTRPYMDYGKKAEDAGRSFQLLKQLWQGRDLLIVEGEQTRLGVGNDLFNQAKSIKRLLGPATNAYGRREEIFSKIEKYYNGELIILALGPTATIFANRLSSFKIQALDIGHIDIEYAWYQMRARKKVPVSGKYTNEACNGDVGIQECCDRKYLDSIIDVVVSDDPK